MSPPFGASGRRGRSVCENFLRPLPPVVVLCVLTCTQDAPNIAFHDEAFGTASPDSVGSCRVLSPTVAGSLVSMELHHPFLGTILPLFK